MIYKSYISCSVIIIVVGFFSFIPKSVIAADLIFDVIENDIGDGTTLIEVRVDPEGKDINVVEGVVSLNFSNPKDILSVDIETGGSVFDLWPLQPEYVASENAIQFAGGTTDGFDYESLIFRIRVSSKSLGIASLSWLGGSAYLDDGKGTAENVSSRSITVSLTEKEEILVLYDVTPPTFESVELGSDPSLFGGKYFLSFYATDDISGVGYYEVLEGQDTTEVTDGVYVLHDQARKTRIFITAYDRAGNSASKEFPSQPDDIKNGITILLITTFFLAVLSYVYKKIFKT